MKNIKALVIIPSDKIYHDVWKAIKKIFSSRDIEVIKPEDVTEVGAKWTNILNEAIRESDIIVAEISGLKPNVLYQLGFAEALRKPTLLLISKDKIGDIPPELTSYQMAFYERENVDYLQRQILRFLDFQLSRLEA